MQSTALEDRNEEPDLHVPTSGRQKGCSPAGLRAHTWLCPPASPAGVGSPNAHRAQGWQATSSRPALAGTQRTAPSKNSLQKHTQGFIKKPHCSLKANGNIITHPARSAGTFYRVMIRNNQVKLIKQRVEIVQPVFLCLHCPTAVPSHLPHQQGHRHTGPAGTQPRDQWPAHQATKLSLRLPSTHRSLGLLHPWGCHAPRDLQGGTSSLQDFYPSAKLAWVGHGWPGRTVNTAVPLSHARLRSIFSPFFFSLFFFTKKHAEEEEKHHVMLSQRNILLIPVFYSCTTISLTNTVVRH